MSRLITIARPYAKAVFDFAIENNNLTHWQSMLSFSASVSRNQHITNMCSGVLSHKNLSKIFITICGKTLDIFGQNLIRIMAKNKRLVILPIVLKYFIFLRLLHEKTIEVNVTSTSPLKKAQLKKIYTALEQRLHCKIKLNCKLDKSIIAGIILRTNDTVIDCSVRGRLKRLESALQF